MPGKFICCLHIPVDANGYPKSLRHTEFYIPLTDTDESSSGLLLCLTCANAIRAIVLKEIVQDGIEQAVTNSLKQQHDSTRNR